MENATLYFIYNPLIEAEMSLPKTLLPPNS